MARWHWRCVFLHFRYFYVDKEEYRREGGSLGKFPGHGSPEGPAKSSADVKSLIVIDFFNGFSRLLIQTWELNDILVGFQAPFLLLHCNTFPRARAAVHSSRARGLG